MNPYLLTRAKVASEIDETDIRALRRFDPADAPVMRRMRRAPRNPPARGETAGTQRRQPPFMVISDKRIGLIHELRQLRRAEELAHRPQR